jgi:hypothetical protein
MFGQTAPVCDMEWSGAEHHYAATDRIHLPVLLGCERISGIGMT